MQTVVHKYGGSSVANLEKLGMVADRISAVHSGGVRLVVVVSAMGNTTNELIGLAREVSPHPDRRELDMLISVGERITMSLLAMALRDRGVPAVSLTGSQSGIITDESHAGANVVEVRPHRVRKHLDQDQVVIVAGFQGVSRAREVTTLGRGGSDMTAVVLAAALDASYCEICSDVDGVWTTDPNAVPEAIKLDTLSLDEALAMARGGARVLYEEATRYARDHGVEIRAQSTFGPGTGTRLITDAGPAIRVTSVAGSDDLCRVHIDPVAPEKLNALIEKGARIRYWVGGEVFFDTQNVHEPIADATPTALVTCVGSGVDQHPDLLRESVSVLTDAGLPITACGTSPDLFWCEVSPDHLDRSVAALHSHWCVPES